MIKRFSFCAHINASGTAGPVCLQSLGTKGAFHPLPTIQNNEPVPQFIETGCKPVLLLLNLVTDDERKHTHTHTHMQVFKHTKTQTDR